MTDYQNNQRMREIIKEITFDKSQKEKGCEYRGKERFCKATTNNNCKKCDFFSPTVPVMINAIVEKYDSLENQIYERDTKITVLELKVEEMTATIKRLNEVIESQKQYTCKDRMRCNPYFSDDKTCDLYKPEKPKKKRKGLNFLVK